jgi:hypothetical protein
MNIGADPFGVCANRVADRTTVPGLSVTGLAGAVLPAVEVPPWLIAEAGVQGREAFEP